MVEGFVPTMGLGSILLPQRATLEFGKRLPCAKELALMHLSASS
jgi:hypothetical protein